MALPTVPDLKVHLNIPAAVTANDDELGDHLDAAIELVENIVGPLTSGDVTEVHRGINSDVLILRRMPATALVSISARYSGTATTLLTLSDYELDTATGIVRLVSGAGFYGTYVVVYTAGAATPPASVKLATLIIAGHLWETQRGTSPTALQEPDIEQSVPFGAGFAIPSRAQALLEPYRLIHVA